MSIPSRSQYHKILTDYLAGKYALCVTNEIVLEYEEILTQKMGRSIASNIVNTILANANTLFVFPHYRFSLIKADPDDNKFVDCAIQSNATYIVTQDHHFDVLKEIGFPKVSLISIDAFLSILYS